MSTRRFSSRRCRALLAALTISAAAGVALTPPAGASTVTFVGKTTGTQSSVTVHKGDQYERVLHPTGTISTVLDTAQGKLLSGAAVLDPTFTDTFVGPFGLQLYVRTDLTQRGPLTGTVTRNANGIATVTSAFQSRFALTVYHQLGTTQNPATDQKLTDPAKCFNDVQLNLTGTADFRTGAFAVHEDQFTIPNFPDGKADPNATCGLATSSLNQQVAGTNNSIDLHFTGAPTKVHFTGVTSGADSTVTIKPGTFFALTVHPQGTISSDLDFSTGQISNTSTQFAPIVTKALPGFLSFLPVYATITFVPTGPPPTGTVKPSSTVGIDDIAVDVTLRMNLTVTLLSPTGPKLTNGATCGTDLPLHLTGTADQATLKVTLGDPSFTLPKLGGCGLLTPVLNPIISGGGNVISLVFHDAPAPTP